MEKLRKIIRDWMLIIAMAGGVGAYLLYHFLTPLHSAGPLLLQICKTAQPIMLFMMLFLSFSKVEPHEMKPHGWMGWILLIQLVSFLGLAALVFLFPESGLKLPLEAAMLCLICPTATACSVVTGKLGGNMAGVITYTVIINLAVAIVVPLVVPIIHPQEGLGFVQAFYAILAKVFPLLILPCLSAWLVRYLFPRLHEKIQSHSDASFKIWAVSLSLAILMSTRAIVMSHAPLALIGAIALASLLSCVFQFWAGRLVGKRHGCKISAGQALGQKNTVFSIWMGYTFLDPITSIAGGFYSIWHNCYNSYQLYKKSHEVQA